MVIAHKSNKIGLILCSALSAFCTGLTIYICYKDSIPWLNYNAPSKMNDLYYSKSYLRGNIYYLGAIFCYATTPMVRRPPRPRAKSEWDNPMLSLEEKLAIKRKSSYKKSVNKQKFMIKLAVIGSIGFLVFATDALIMHYYFQWGRNSVDLGQFWNTMFITFGKVVFVVSFLAFLLSASAAFPAFGSFIANNRFIQLLGNIGFTGYLFHFTIIMVRIFSCVELPTYSFYDLLGSWMMDVFLTIPLAVLATLIVELPV